MAFFLLHYNCRCINRGVTACEAATCHQKGFCQQRQPLTPMSCSKSLTGWGHKDAATRSAIDTNFMLGITHPLKKQKNSDEVSRMTWNFCGTHRYLDHKYTAEILLAIKIPPLIVLYLAVKQLIRRTYNAGETISAHASDDRNNPAQRWLKLM